MYLAIVGLFLVLICVGVYSYQQTHKDDIKSIIYLNAIKKEELDRTDFLDFERLVQLVEDNTEQVKNPEMRAGGYSYQINYNNGKEKNVFINATYCFIDGKCYISSDEFCEQFGAFLC